MDRPGFEPGTSALRKRRSTIDLSAQIRIQKYLINLKFIILWASSLAWLERPADNRKVESSNLSWPTDFMKGIFIVFEGITGAGKRTHIRILSERLRRLGKEVVNITFPNYETDIAKLTKRSDFDPFTLSLLYAADRSLYQERIKGLLERGIIVIADRYCYSNFAYQSVRNVPLEWLISIEKNIIKPNLVFLIDTPLERGIARIQQANIEDFTKREMLERIKKEREQIERIRAMYLKLAKEIRNGSKWVVIDGTKNDNIIAEEIWNVVIEEIKKSNE